MGCIIKTLLLLILTLLLHPVFAEDDGATTEEDINATNRLVAAKWEQFNRSVDMFFTNQGSRDQENKSSIMVYSSFYKKEGRSVEADYDFHLRIDLPNTTKKLKIVIEKQQDEISDALSDSTVSNKSISKTGQVTDAKRQNNYAAGANILLKQSKYFVSLFNFGIRLNMPLNPFAKLELQKDIKTKHMNIELSQKVLYYRQAGLQEISQLTLNKKFNQKVQLDFINSLVWSEETDYIILRNSFVLYHSLGHEKGLTYSVGANTRFHPYRYDSFDTSLSYRQLIYNEWLYGTWTIGADYPKANDYKDEKFVQFRIDLYFKEKS